MSATAFQRLRREAMAKAKASQSVEETVEETEEEQDTQQEKDNTSDTQEEATTEIKLSDLSEEDLMKYAQEKGIDIGNATSKKGILKKIKATE